MEKYFVSTMVVATKVLVATRASGAGDFARRMRHGEADDVDGEAPIVELATAPSGLEMALLPRSTLSDALAGSDEVELRVSSAEVPRKSRVSESTLGKALVPGHPSLLGSSLVEAAPSVPLGPASS